MSLLSDVKRAVRVGSVQVWRNGWLSFTTVAIGVLILFLLNSIIAVQIFTDQQLADLRQRADFSVLLSDDYDAFTLDGMLNALTPLQAGGQVFPATEWNGIPIPPTLRVRIGDLAQTDDVFEILTSSRYDRVIADWDRDEESAFREIIDRLLALESGVGRLSRVLMILFFFGGTLLMTNTFQMVLFTRRDEIEVARTLGAETGFLIGPFLFEGALLGAVAAALAAMLFSVTLTQVQLPHAGIIFQHMIDHAYAPQTLISALVGVLGAGVSSIRYLRRR